MGLKLGRKILYSGFMDISGLFKAPASGSPVGPVGQRDLADVLFERKVLNENSRNSVKLQSINTGDDVEKVIADQGLASEDDIAAAKGVLFGIPYVELSKQEFLADVLNFVPEPVARRYALIPFKFDLPTNTLCVAMADPLDLTVISFLEKKTGKKISPYISGKTAILTCVDEKYNQGLSTEVTAALKDVAPSVEEPEKQATAAPNNDVIRDAPVAKIADSLLEFGTRSRSTDIHIEPLDDHTRVRFRIDGILYEKLVLPRKVHDSLVSRIKIMSNLKIDERRIPQDGRFTFGDAKDQIDVRVSTLPTVFGEKVVLRLLRKGSGAPTLAELGLRGLALRNLEIAILRPHGIILVCGPTGSGKTTTLYAVLSKVNSAKVNIVTIEDPVEYQIGGVNQVQINTLAGLTFATGLRAFLRQDPNIILVGEIRDGETTDLAIQGALTGHLMFSTLHTSNAAGAIPRLLDLGAEPFLLSSSLNAVVGQRILRKICPNCKEPYNPPEIMATDIRSVLGKLLPADKQSGPVTLFKGRGCKECGDAGFLGRVGIYEVLPISDHVSQLVLARADAIAIEKLATEEGMITMKQDGYLKALEGITTIEEVLRVAQD